MTFKAHIGASDIEISVVRKRRRTTCTTRYITISATLQVDVKL